MVVDFVEAGIWTGWLAFLIFVPLALTSNDWSLRTLGPAWKIVQRFTYAATLLTLVHWVLVAHGPGGVIVHFAPLALLEAYRLWWNLRPRTARA